MYGTPIKLTGFYRFPFTPEMWLQYTNLDEDRDWFHYLVTLN